MKKILVASIGVFLWSAGLSAQITTPLPGKCTAFRPESLYSSILFTDVAEKLAKSKDFGQGSTAKAKEYWIVYSDREDNPTFTAPGSTKVYKKLAFNEKVRIAKIENGYALVYSEPKEQAIYPALSSQIDWKGWIPMTKLLLWNTCPANRKGIYEKAMLCANIDENLGNGNLGKLFKDPQNTKKYEGLSINFNYYFVMKREGSMVLLATQNTMNGDSYKVLYGWVDQNSYVEWNQRSCLEPTWEIEDVEFFAKNGVKVNIYDDRSMQSKASYITFTKKNTAGYDPYMYRMNGATLRYPILDNSLDNAWNCSTFSSTGSKGAINAGTTEIKKDDAIFKKNLDELANIKIAIVIDGTRSMEKYFPAVRDAIKEFTSFFKKTDKVQVGVLIYRDKQDGDYVTESFPMTSPNNPALAEFLNTGGQYGIKSSPKDKSLEESLYYGINKALDSFSFRPEHSNMMFVIGDCGNSPDFPEITKEIIQKKLVEKNVTLMGFQVRNDSGSPAYTVFNNNICDLILGSLQAKFDLLASGVVVKAGLKKNAYEFTNNASSIENSLYVGTHKYVQSGVMDINELKGQLNEAVVDVKKAIDHQRELIVEVGNGVRDGTALENRFGNNSQISGPVLDNEWLAKRLGKEWAENLKKTNSTVSFKGYTLKKDKASDRDYYKSVIFISQQELNTLMIRLAPLYEVSQRKGNDRQPYVQAMKALVQSMLPGISDAEMNAMGYDEVMGLVSGLNASTITLKGRSIAEVASTQAVNASEYQTIIAKFKRQYQKLQSIQKRPYPFVREFNGAKYYWIPTEDLP